jgi:replicative DNA helicase
MSNVLPFRAGQPTPEQFAEYVSGIELPAEAWPSMAELADRVLRELRHPVGYIATGIEPLDGLLDGGLRGGEVMVVAARPGIGKSAFALQVILNVASDGVPVGLWSLEMSHEAWLRRGIASIASVDNRSVRRGELGPLEMERAVRVGEEIGRLPVLPAIGETTPDNFTAEARAMVKARGAQLLVIDYLQLMQAPPGAFSRENEVAQLSRAIKLTATELDVAVLLIAQLNRDAEDKQPTLANLRESGSIEQDADVVFFIHRPRDGETKRPSDEGWGIVEKNRDGATGRFRLTFEGRHLRFRT